MKRLRAAGFEAFLIGETLMKESKPGGALASMLRGGLKQANVY
jgi:indole-3-glycerol phosphate synthase